MNFATSNEQRVNFATGNEQRVKSYALVNLNLILKLRLFQYCLASMCTALVNNSKRPEEITYNSAAILTSIKFGNSVW